MDNRPIGVFDSGLGGLSVVKQLKKQLPNEQILYFGDTDRTPYGTKSTNTLKQYTAQDCNFLLQSNVKMIVAACGTISSLIDRSFAESLPVPLLGIIAPTAEAAAAATKTGCIGVIGTDSTVRSGSFQNALARYGYNRVTAVGCPLFVSLVEQGHICFDDPQAIKAAQNYLSFLKGTKIDTLILGCTHFPLLAPVLQKTAGNDIFLVDPGIYTATAVKKLLQQQNLLCSRRTQDDRYYVSGNLESFAKTAKAFLGYDISGQLQKACADHLPTSIFPLESEV